VPEGELIEEDGAVHEAGGGARAARGHLTQAVEDACEPAFEVLAGMGKSSTMRSKRRSQVRRPGVRVAVELGRREAAVEVRHGTAHRILGDRRITANGQINGILERMTAGQLVDCFTTTGRPLWAWIVGPR
jgi:hypothetical protein